MMIASLLRPLDHLRTSAVIVNTNLHATVAFSAVIQRIRDLRVRTQRAVQKQRAEKAFEVWKRLHDKNKYRSHQVGVSVLSDGWAYRHTQGPRSRCGSPSNTHSLSVTFLHIQRHSINPRVSINDSYVRHQEAWTTDSLGRGGGEVEEGAEEE